ncbi:MAG: ribbon-helix-helix domain-containing protein [Thermoplasmatota archaeon]
MDVESERVTIRLPKEDLDLIDAFVVAGESSNRSEVIRRAVREYATEHAKKLTARVQAQKEAKAALAQIVADRENTQQLDATVEKLAKR